MQNTPPSPCQPHFLYVALNGVKPLAQQSDTHIVMCLEVGPHGNSYQEYCEEKYMKVVQCLECTFESATLYSFIAHFQ